MLWVLPDGQRMSTRSLPVVLPNPKCSRRWFWAQKTLPPHLAATPKIVNVTVEQDDWSELGEMAVQN